MNARNDAGSCRGLAGLVALGILVFGSAVVAIPPDREQPASFSSLGPPGGSEPTPRIFTAADLQPSDGLRATYRVAGRSSMSVGFTGGDNCNEATVITVAVGPLGNPNTVTINGDLAPATGPECAGLSIRWWEAFEVEQCAKVTIGFCGTTPHLSPTFFSVVRSCALDGSTCGNFLGADYLSVCGDGNISISFDTLPPGTYYYPIIADESVLENPPGPYVMHITAEQCAGACCDAANHICTEDALEADCDGAEQTWHPGMQCLESGCVGACCDPASGTCTEDVLVADCAGAGQTPYPGIHCIESGCVGACCDTDTRICTDRVAPVNCAGPQQIWTGYSRCCELECRDPAGPEYDASGVELMSRVPISSFPSASDPANDVWGYTSPSGREYAIIGLTEGTGFVDLSDPYRPIVIADIPDARSEWSDMAVYGEYAYNVNENRDEGELQIIDLTDIDNGTVTLVGSAVGGLRSAHNIYVNPDSGHAYPCGTNDHPGFMAFDLSDPANPIPVGVWNDHYVHDLYVVNYDACPIAPPDPRAGQPCEIAFAAAASAVYIVDVTTKSNMTTISTLTYPTVAYCHQCWLSEDRRYLFFNDELDELYGTVPSTRTYVADVQDLANPSLAHTYDHPGCWTDHNLIVQGDRVFNAHYAAGLRVLDAADPLNLAEVAYFDTHPGDNAQGFEGVWGVYVFPSGIILASDRERGLFVLCIEGTCPPPSCPLSNRPDPELLNDEQVNAKNRYLSIKAGTPKRTHAIRVRFVDLPPPFHIWNGMDFWVGPPREVCENSGKGLETAPEDCPEALPTRTFWTAPLRCAKEEAHFMDWHGQCVAGECVGGVDPGSLCLVTDDCQVAISLHHEGIIPDGVYDIQAIDDRCPDLNNDADYSLPLTMTQSRWGDVCGPSDAGACTAVADGSADVQNDVLGVLDKFANVIDLQKTRADIEGTGVLPLQEVDMKVNVANDVLFTLDAFTGAPYPFAPKDPCNPGLVRQRE